VIAAAHANAPVASADPWLDALSRFIDRNQGECSNAPELFPLAKVDALARASRVQLDRLRPLLQDRGSQSLVRCGHGDLYLGNIALIDGKPVPFDAIEFDPIFATGDVLYDLAFLLMDLVERGLQQAANAVLNRYLLQTRREATWTGLAALPLFLSLCAAIRAKVMTERMKNDNSESRNDIAPHRQEVFRSGLRADRACSRCSDAPDVTLARARASLVGGG
jgi:hypothetical protein